MIKGFKKGAEFRPFFYFRANFNPMKRWIILGFFGLMAAMSQAFWLNYAALGQLLKAKYSTGDSENVLLMMVFPLLYVLLSQPSGRWIDRRGYAPVVALGGLLMAVFALGRLYQGGFYWLLAMQAGIALGQPLVVNGISKLVSERFPADLAGTATGLGSASMFIGMGLGIGLTPELVQGDSLFLADAVFAGLAVLGFVGFGIAEGLGSIRAGSLEPGHDSGNQEKLSLKTPGVLILSLVSGLALGVFNGLMAAMEWVLRDYGIGADDAGLAAALLILGGIVGAVVVPPISDKTKKRRPFIRWAAWLGMLGIGVLLGMPLPMAGLFGLSFITGMVFLTGYPLILAASEEEAGSALAGQATSWIMLAGNAGGVLLTVVTTAIWEGSHNPVWIIALYVVLLLLAGGLAGIRKRVL